MPKSGLTKCTKAVSTSQLRLIHFEGLDSHLTQVQTIVAISHELYLLHAILERLDAA